MKWKCKKELIRQQQSLRLVYRKLLATEDFSFYINILSKK